MLQKKNGLPFISIWSSLRTTYFPYLFAMSLVLHFQPSKKIEKKGFISKSIENMTEKKYTELKIFNFEYEFCTFHFLPYIRD